MEVDEASKIIIALVKYQYLSIKRSNMSSERKIYRKVASEIFMLRRTPYPDLPPMQISKQK